MDFADQIAALAARIPKQVEHIQTEEATKNAFVMPFIAALGYNVFDPTEVVPEFTADVGTKKGEKVDYAIIKDGKPIILFECKKAGSNLDGKPPSQLFRYFACTEARIGILTDGIVFRFYSDLEKANTMDDRPFLEFNMLAHAAPMVRELKRFCKGSFNLDETLTAAVELKYTRAIKVILGRDMQAPSEELVRYFASQVYEGRLVPSVKEQFTEITKRAMHQFFNDLINERLKSALGTADSSDDDAKNSASVEDESEPSNDDGIVTTQEETDAYNIVRAIVREVVDPGRVAMRDTKSYCGVLFDDNNRKPIVRLRFNSSQLYLGLFDAEKKERKVKITGIDDIYQYADDIKAAALRYVEPEAH